MKELRKRIFAAVLAVLMIAAAMPATALYASAETESVSGNAAGQAGTGEPGTAIEELIAALPDTVTEDNADDVRARLDEILDLYRELDEGEQEEIDLSRIYALQGALDAANAPMAAAGRAEQQDTDAASVAIGGETLYYATLEEAFAAANRQTATITMLNDAECVHSGSAGSPLNINGGNVTLNLNGKTLSGKGYGNYGIINVSGGSLLVEREGNISVPDGAIGLSCYSGGTLTVTAVNIVLGSDSSTAYAGVDNEGGTVILNGTQMTGAASNGQIYHYSGTTTVNNVTATGATESNPKSVSYYNEGTLTINSGTFDKIVVDSGNYSGVKSVAELLGAGRACRKQDGSWATADEMAGLEISNVTVAKIPLTIHPQGDTSWYYSTQQTHTLAMNAAPVDSSDSVTYVWKSGTETLDCTSDAYTVPADTPVGSYTYTCEATCDGYTLSHTFTFKIEKSGTDLTSEGEVKTYNGDTLTTSFSAGDTITVKATPTPTGAAPQKAAARLQADPTEGQMVVYVGTTQVSVPADKGEDGVYTMEVSASDVLLAAGGPGTEISLTAKFVGNDNMADGQGTATVNITAAAKAERGGTLLGYYDESGLDTAFVNSGNAGATFTLLANVERTSILIISISCTLDLNGKTIHSTGQYESALGISSGATVTIRGDGTVTSEHGNGLSVGGTATLEGGNFISGAADYGGVNVGGKLIVTGENVVMRNTGNGNGLSVNSGTGATAQLSAGTCEGGAAAVKIYGSTGTLAGLLNQAGTSRVAYYKDNATLVTEGLGGQTLPSGSYTVKACTHIFGSSPTCLACGEQAVARVTIGDAVTHYGDLPSAWVAVQGQTADLYLLKSVDAAGVGRWGRLELASGSVTLGMAEDVVLSGSSNVVIKLTGGELTLNSGTIRNNGTTSIPTGLQVNDGTLRISGGTVEANWALYINGGHAEITGGTFTATGEYSVGLRKDEGTVKISGGAFSGSYRSVKNTTEGETVATLLAEDYAFKQGGAWVTDTSGKELTDSVTVAKAPVKITAQPTGGEVTYGTDASLSVTAAAVDESQAITYQWYQAGENSNTEIAGATAASYTVSSLGAGTYSFYCTVTCDSYTVKSETVTVTVKPRQLTPAITGTASKTYDGTTDVASGQLSIALTGVVTGDTVTASATSYAYDNANAGENKIITASGITLEGTDEGNYTLTQNSATIKGTITKADQTAPAAPTAAEENIKDISITLTVIENAEYSIDGTNWQESPGFTRLNPNQAYTFYARLKEDDNHNASPSSAGTSITTKKTMLDSAVVTVSGSYTYTGVAIVPEAGNVEVVLNGTKIASSQYTISATNNVNAGNATLTVTATENGNYSGSVSSTFTINRAVLTVTASDQSITCGGSITQGTGQVTATGLCGGDTLGGITLTASTGEVPGGDITPSAAQIRNSSGADVTANYNIAYETGKLAVSYMEPPAAILCNGAEKKEWYGGDVAVTADSSGYTVSDTLGGDYKASYTISAQEGTVTKTLYFKDEAGHMSDGVEVTVKFDLTPPTGEIAVGAKWWQNVLHFVSFGNYAAKEYTVSIKAEDKNGSGVSKIEYAIVTGADQYTDAGALEAANLSWTEYDSSSRPTVDANTGRYVAYARLTDNVGNVTYISTDGILLDNTPPTVGSLTVPEDTRKDVTAGVTFTVSEAADYYYVVLPKDSTAPSAEDIIVTCGGTLPEGGTGTAIAGTFPKGSGAVSADTPGASVDVKNLQPYTAYSVYVTAVDRAVDITNSAEGTPAGNTGNVAQADFTTKKTLPVITKNPAISGTYGQTAGEMTLTGGAATDAKGTAVTGTWEVGSADRDKKPSAGTAEKVTVTFTPDSDSFDGVSVEITPAVGRRNLNADGVTVSEVAGTYTYTGSEIKPPVAVGTGTPAEGIYISDSGAALTANDFTVSYSNNMDAGVKTASVAITEQGNYTGSVTRNFTIGKAPGREVPDLRGNYIDNGQAYTYTVTPTDGAVYRMGDDGAWQEGNVFEGIKPGTSVTFYAKIPGDKNHEEGTPKSITVDFPKLTPAAPALTYQADRTNPADVKVTITPVSGAEYSFDGGVTWESGEGANVQDGFTISQTVTLAIRLKETDTHNPSPARTMAVNLAKGDREAPPAFSLEALANGETDYTVTIPATEGCEYSFDGEHWSDVHVKTGVNVGESVTGYKRYKETDEYNTSSAVSDTKMMEKFTVKTPVITPEGGSFEGSVSVTITCGSSGAEIYYTTDGSTPGRSSTRYTGAFMVAVPATVKAVAIKDGLNDSAVATASYTKKDGDGSGGNSGGNGGNSGGNEENGGSGGNGGNSGGNEENGGNGGNSGGNGGNSGGNGGGNGTPAEGSGQPFIKGEDGKIGWDVIRAEEEQAEEGSAIHVDMNGSAVVPGDIFDSIKGKDITITFDMGGGILWSVDGKSISADKAGDIDFSVKTGVHAIPVDIVNRVTGGRYSIQMSLAHEGEFGFTAVLSIGLGRENAGYTANLYYYRKSAGELEFICADTVAEDGTVSLAFTHASDYVIAIDGEKESGGATEPAQPETPGGNNAVAAESPKTGQEWRPWRIVAAVLLAAAIGTGAAAAKRKKRRRGC